MQMHEGSEAATIRARRPKQSREIHTDTHSWSASKSVDTAKHYWTGTRCLDSQHKQQQQQQKRGWIMSPGANVQREYLSNHIHRQNTHTLLKMICCSLYFGTREDVSLHYRNCSGRKQVQVDTFFGRLNFRTGRSECQLYHLVNCCRRQVLTRFQRRQMGSKIESGADCGRHSGQHRRWQWGRGGKKGHCRVKVIRCKLPTG